MFGAILARFHYVAYGAGALLLVTLAAMAAARPAAGVRRARALVGGDAGRGALLGLRRAEHASTRSSRRSAACRRAAGDARRVRFDELHRSRRADDGQHRRRAGAALLGSEGAQRSSRADRRRRHRPRGHGAPSSRSSSAPGLRVEWEPHLAGVRAIERARRPLPAELLDSIRRNKVALKGPVTTPVGGGFTSVNVGLRKALDLFANLRPVWNIPSVPSRYEGVDLVIVRENTEDLYSGPRARGRAGRGREPEDHHRGGVDAHRDVSPSSTRGSTAASA